MIYFSGIPALIPLLLKSILMQLSFFYETEVFITLQALKEDPKSFRKHLSRASQHCCLECLKHQSRNFFTSNLQVQLLINLYQLVLVLQKHKKSIEINQMQIYHKSDLKIFHRIV